MRSSDITPEIRKEMKARELMKGWGEADILKAWFGAREEDKFTLHPREDFMRKRWMAARGHFLNLKNYSEITKLLMEEFDIAIAQARNDIAHMQEVFGDIEKVSKDAHRARAIDMALRAYKIAEEDRDADGMAKSTKVYVVAAGLDKEEPEQIDIKKLMDQRVYAEVLDPAIRNLLLNLIQNAGGVMDASRLFEQMLNSTNIGEITDFEDVTAAPDDNA